MRKKARIVALAVAVIFLFGSVMPVVAADGTQALKAIFRNIKIVVNGSTLVSDKEPFIVDGTTYVPIRLVAEATGATVEWEQAQGRVVVTTAPSVDPAELQKEYQKGYDNGLKVGELTGYTKGLQEGKALVEDKRNAEEDYDEGYEDGLEAGEEDGFEAGEDDYSRNRKSDWEKAMPSDSTIKKDYKLSSKSSDYADGFLDGYEEGFEEGYEDGYDSDDYYWDGYDEGWLDGYYDGYEQGEYDNSRGRSYNDRTPSAKTIISDYDLDDEPSSYEEGFIDGYEDNYYRGYEDGYYGEDKDPDRR